MTVLVVSSLLHYIFKLQPQSFHRIPISFSHQVFLIFLSFLTVRNYFIFYYYHLRDIIFRLRVFTLSISIVEKIHLFAKYLAFKTEARSNIIVIAIFSYIIHQDVIIKNSWSSLLNKV